MGNAEEPQHRRRDVDSSSFVEAAFFAFLVNQNHRNAIGRVGRVGHSRIVVDQLLDIAVICSDDDTTFIIQCGINDSADALVDDLAGLNTRRKISRMTDHVSISKISND